MEDKKQEAKKITFDGAITEVNSALLKCPDALSIYLTKKEGRHCYLWSNQSAKAKGVRNEVKKILSTLWQSGAYNYQQIADILRVDITSIRALLDADFQFMATIL